MLSLLLRLGTAGHGGHVVTQFLFPLSRPRRSWSQESSRRTIQEEPARTKATDERTLRLPISCTPHETRLFQWIVEVIQAHCPDTVVRVAGDWVRGKLCGLPLEKKMDLVIDVTRPRVFGSLLWNHPLRTQFHATAPYTLRPRTPTDVQQTIMVVDGWNLVISALKGGTPRSLADSMKVFPRWRPKATVFDDTLSRGFTINALFYNLVTKEVEDLSGLGLDDLQSGVLRTLRDADDTLREDSPWVMSAAKLIAEMGVTPTQELRVASLRRGIVEGVRQKMSSRGRGANIVAVLDAPERLKGLQFLGDCGLYAAIFAPQMNWSEAEWQDGQENIRRFTQLLDLDNLPNKTAYLLSALLASKLLPLVDFPALLARDPPPSRLIPVPVPSNEFLDQFVHASAGVPHPDLVRRAFYKGSERSATTARTLYNTMSKHLLPVFRDSLVLSNKWLHIAASLMSSATCFLTIFATPWLKAVADAGGSVDVRQRLLRNMVSHPFGLGVWTRSPGTANWEISLRFAEAIQGTFTKEWESKGLGVGVGSPGYIFQASEIVSMIEETGMRRYARNVPPILRGNELEDMTGIVGKGIAEALEELILFQVVHPDATREDATQWIQRHYGSRGTRSV